MRFLEQQDSSVLSEEVYEFISEEGVNNIV